MMGSNQDIGTMVDMITALDERSFIHAPRSIVNHELKASI
jgi:hypothetical protein